MNKIFTLFFLFISFNTLAQLGSNDLTFNPMDPGFSNGVGPNSQVRAVSIQPDGKVIIGGYFTSFNEKNINRIARIDNGVLDTSFTVGIGFNDYVQCIAIQSDGKILLGGNFTSYNGVARNRIARLNADGTIDLTFNPSTGFNSLVRSIVVQSDGKIIVGGNFTSFNGTSRNRIARLNANGTLDTSYNPGTGFNNIVYTVAIQADNKVLVGGTFTLFNGTIRERIARLDVNGALDTSFDPGFGFDNTVYSISVLNTGSYIVGGDFGYFNGTVRNKIAKINAAGILDMTFDPLGGFNYIVHSTSIQSDGKIIAGGEFTSFNGTAVNRILRLNTNGGIDPTFNSGTGFNSGGGAVVYSTDLHTDGRVVVGGNFSTYDGKARNNIARIFQDGKLDLSLNMFTGFNDLVRAVAIQSDGKIIAGGEFKFFNGVECSGIARLNTDGTLDTTFNIGSGISFNLFNASVYAIAIQSDGKILVGGDFFGYNGNTNVKKLTRLNSDGTLDSTFNAGNGTTGKIFTIAIQSDGKIVIGGDFTAYDGTPANRIARINSNGSFDASFNTGTGTNSGFDHNVLTIAIQGDGKILAGGGFSSYKGTYFNNRIARLTSNGNLDPTFYHAVGFNATIDAIAIQTDGKILVGGNFTNFNGVSRTRIARLMDDGTLDASFYPGSSGFNGQVKKILIQTDGKILVGGAFTTYNLVNQKRIVRLNPNGTLDNSISFGGGFTATVESMALQNDGKIIAAGDFTAFDNVGRNRIARINNCMPSIIDLFPIACYTYTFNGQTYTSSGTYTFSYTNSYNCDSIVNLNLVINSDTDTTINITACDSYNLNGQIITSSGNFMDIIPNSSGCDSTIYLNLTIKESSTSAITASSCSNYTFNGQTYTASGIYYQTLTNALGCDSLITLNLSVLNSDSTLSVSACGQYTLNGQVYTNAGTYTQLLTNSAGCDSVLTLNLTLLNSNATVTATACESYILNGQTYNTSGNYTQVVPNAAGCDSIITLNLTIHQNTTSSNNITACGSYSANGTTYHNSGTFTQIIQNSKGCDSTITLNLTINTVDASISQNGFVLTANASGAAYQWIDCNNPTNPNLAGETGQSFIVTKDGKYAVEVTENNCKEVSDCIEILGVGIANKHQNETIKLYPNPTQGSIFITSPELFKNAGLKITTLAGKTILESTVSDKFIVPLDLDAQPSGVYFVEVNQGEKLHRFKVIKK